MSATVQLKVNLPKKLVNDLEPILVAKDLTLDEAVRMYLRALISANEKTAALGLSSELPFGKFKGELVSVVLKAEPDYIAWMLVNSKYCKFNTDVLTELNKHMNPVVEEELNVIPIKKRSKRASNV